MAWLESHQAVLRHPKTRRLARQLSLKPVHAIGHLHALWYWAMDYAPDGNIGQFDVQEIAAGAEWDDDAALFVEALVEAGFVDRDPEGALMVHDWDEYGGKLLDRKDRNAERMRRARATKTPPPSPDPEAGASHVQRTLDARAKLPNQTVQDSTGEDSTNTTDQPSRARETSGGGSAGYGMTDDDDARRHEIYQAVLPSVNITGHAAAEHRLFALVGRWVDGDLAAEPDPVGLAREWFDAIGRDRDTPSGRVTSLTLYAENHLAERQRGRPRLQVVRDEDPPDYPSSPVTIWNDLRDEVHRQTVSGELDKKFHFMSGDWGFQTFDAVSFDGHVLILTSRQAWDEHYRRNWAATLHRLAASRGQDIAVHWQEDGYAAVG